MRTGIPAAVALLVVALTAGRTASAAEGRADRETDHVDAFDDGGPRSFGLFLNPLALALGTAAAEGDFVLGDAAALSVEGNWTSVGTGSAVGVTVGVPLFPWRIMFHGFYLHPRVMAARVDSDGASADVLGIGGSLGWQHTFRFGLSLRVGGGAAYEVALGPENTASAGLTGVRPLLDGEVGWVF